MFFIHSFTHSQVHSFMICSFFLLLELDKKRKKWFLTFDRLPSSCIEIDNEKSPNHLVDDSPELEHEGELVYVIKPCASLQNLSFANLEQMSTSAKDALYSGGYV